jgi:hypothetical protein
MNSSNVQLILLRRIVRHDQNWQPEMAWKDLPRMARIGYTPGSAVPV